VGEACVGRKITIGYQNTTEQAILAELLAILIEERTGTKVILKEVEDSHEAHRALEASEIQIYIEYTGIGLSEILGEKPEKDPKKVYKRVKKAYSKNFNLIWLKTFGFNSTNGKAENKDLPLYPAPVVRKDTLEKFPALARLINKLNGKIDDQTMGQLIAQVEQEGKNPKEVAGSFLGKLGIAFSFTPGQA
jgi:osmoprotectant transport system substrate-binding protein